MKTIQRKSICLLLICIFSGVVSYQAMGTGIELIPPEGWDAGKKSMTIQPPISASVEAPLLHIQCLRPTVDVTVRIIQNGITVYEEIVPAANTDHVWVDLSGYAEGVYTLDLTNLWGGHVYGDFYLQY